MAVKNKISVFDIALVAILAAIIFVLEQLLSNIPGVQLTIFLIVLFSKKLGTIKTCIIIIIHVLLDNFAMSSFSLIYTPAMLIGWLIIPLTLNTIFKCVANPILLGLLGALYAFIYSWCFIIPSYLINGIKPIDYLISDFIFEIILAICSFLSIFWLYKPCDKLFNLLLRNNDVVE